MKFSTRAISLTVMMFTSFGVMAAPGDGVKSSKHDFTDDASTAIGLCTFCHTPHKGLFSKLLWNHTLSTNNFAWDVPSTTAGTTFATIDGDTYQGATAKCLSCHDGSVAVGDINWFNAGDPGVLYNKQHNQPGDAYSIGTGGNMKGNHPVAHPFPYNNQPSTYNGNTTGSMAYLDEWVTDPVAGGIRLFNDDGAGNITAGAIVGKSGIECSSCHDPHNKKVAGQFFLRGTLTGNDTNYICLKCHIK